MHATLKDVQEQKSAVSSPGLLSRAGSFLKRHRLCLVIVIIPTLLSSIYFGFIASDIYTSQSCFIVRSPQLQSQSVSGLGSLLQSSGLGGSTESSEDAATVEGFILSRDALTELNQQLDVRSAWSSKKIDFLRRFGVFGFMNNFEYLYLYYQNRVDVELSTSSDLITLSVNAFSADQAHQINEMLLQESERLINKLNDRARQDLIGYSMDEVESAKKELARASLAVSDYRNEKVVIDPVQQSTLNFELISSLQGELIATKTELANLRAFAPDSPNPPTLELRAKTLQTSIDAEMAKVAGNQDSLSTKDARYKELVLERDFAGQQLSAALASLQTARDDAQRQQLYLAVVAQPNRPDVAIDPKRMELVLVTLIVSLVAWGISSMLVAGIREHQL
jgi:capsular polysaccharide transport system permease protein